MFKLHCFAVIKQVICKKYAAKIQMIIQHTNEYHSSKRKFVFKKENKTKQKLILNSKWNRDV